MHKLCHILSDSRFWDTVRTAWEQLWWVPLFPAVTFSYPSILPGITSEMLTLISLSLKPPPKFSPLFSHWSCCILGCASFTYRSQTHIHPNTSETGTILPEAEPGNLFGCIFLSQEKGAIFAQIRALWILWSLMEWWLSAAHSTQSRSSTKTPKIHFPVLTVRNLVFQALNQPFPAPPSSAGAHTDTSPLELPHHIPKLHRGYSNTCFTLDPSYLKFSYTKPSQTSQTMKADDIRLITEIPSITEGKKSSITQVLSSNSIFWTSNSVF